MRLAVVASIVSLFAVGASVALGHTRTFESDVSLGLDSVGGGTDTAWYGYVASPRAKCVSARRVRVFRKVDGPDELIGQNVTGSRPGTADNEYVVYQAGYPPADGEYYAKVLRKVLVRSERHKHVCGAARSVSMLVASFR